MLLLLLQNLSVTKAPRTVNITSLDKWGTRTTDLTTGDQIKLAAGSGVLKLEQPLLLSSGVDVVGVADGKGLVFECGKNTTSAVTIM